MSINTAQVKNIITEVGEFITQLYHNHHAGHIIEDGREAITIADIEGERQLLTRLTDLAPGSIGIGEEDIVSRGKTGLSLPSFSADDTVWFVDPIDGTSSFKSQRDDFALMVGLQQRGVLTHGWIYFPLQNMWLEGALGEGATVNGAPVTLKKNIPLKNAAICIDPHHFPSNAAAHTPLFNDLLEEEAIATAYTETAFYKRWPGVYSCLEARWLLTNHINFLCHANGLAWDNAAKVAIYRAAGGVVRLLSGVEYTIQNSADVRMQKRGLLYAPSEADWQAAQAAFAPLRAYFGRQNLI